MCDWMIRNCVNSFGFEINLIFNENQKNENQIHFKWERRWIICGKWNSQQFERNRFFVWKKKYSSESKWQIKFYWKICCVNEWTLSEIPLSKWERKWEQWKWPHQSAEFIRPQIQRWVISIVFSESLARNFHPRNQNFAFKKNGRKSKKKLETDLLDNRNWCDSHVLFCV